MRQYRVKDRREVHELITAALSELGRSYTPFNYGVVEDQSTGGQIIYFDLPRLSPLQFNIATQRITNRQGLIERIKRAITDRLSID